MRKRKSIINVNERKLKCFCFGDIEFGKYVYSYNSFFSELQLFEQYVRPVSTAVSTLVSVGRQSAYMIAIPIKITSFII